MTLRILDIILVVVTLLTIYRLYSILGRRTQNDDTHSRAKSRWSFPFPGKSKPKKASESSSPPDIVSIEGPRFEGPHRKILTKIAKECAGTFMLKSFLKGAKGVYEMILPALNEKKSSVIEHFSTGTARVHFQTLLAEKVPSGSKQHLEIITVDEPDLQGASYKNGKAQLEILFGCRYLAFTENAKGRVVKGSKSLQATTQDIWTFTKNVKKPSTFWLVESITQGPQRH